MCHLIGIKSQSSTGYTFTTQMPFKLLSFLPSSSRQSTSQVLLIFEGPAHSDAALVWFPPEFILDFEWRAPVDEGSRWFFLLSSFLWLWLFSLYGDFLWEEVELSGCRRCWAVVAGRRGECLLPELFSSCGTGISLSEPSKEMGPSLSEKGSASDSSSDLGESGASGAFEES